MPLMVHDHAEPLHVEPRAVRIMSALGYRLMKGSPEDQASSKTAETQPTKSQPEPTNAPEVKDVAVPKGNASRAAWRDYAEGLGINTEGLTRADIRTAVKEAQNG